MIWLLNKQNIKKKWNCEIKKTTTNYRKKILLMTIIFDENFKYWKNLTI